MKLADFLDVTNTDLIVRRYHNQKERWTASFEKCEVKLGGILKSEYGDGNSPDEAIEDYLRQISGKKIVFNAYTTDNRKEMVFPVNIEHESVSAKLSDDLTEVILDRDKLKEQVEYYKDQARSMSNTNYQEEK